MTISHLLFIHLSVDGYLDLFPLWAIVNNSARNTRVQVFFGVCGHVFSSLLAIHVGVTLVIR